MGGTSGRMLLFPKPPQQDLQEPFHLEVHNCGTYRVPSLKAAGTPAPHTPEQSESAIELLFNGNESENTQGTHATARAAPLAWDTYCSS